uniref:F-box/kelch-repeat protein At3g23880 family n=1 Tax=Cajanus cajan TaxID=3821 RepID=A0A151SKK8_CAJCA|nr:F-box/kelch-repeat protein At3g23880 family [Cajanus cajan]
MEILSFIPVKALMRFRCVSKPWNSSMFTPTFVKLHYQRSSRNTHVLIESKYGFSSCSLHHLLEEPSSVIKPGRETVEKNYNVSMVCKGLVCMLSFDFLYKEYLEFWVQLWNPATRLMSKESPRFRICDKNDKFDKYNKRFGFGYNDQSDIFKVVVVLLNTEAQQMEVISYYSGDKCWKKILTLSNYPITGHEMIGEFVNDTINWLVDRPKLCSHHQGETSTTGQMEILSFDMKNETCIYMLMPSHVDSEPNLKVLKDYLCLYYDHMKTHLVVWLMKEYGVDKSWTQLLNISYEHLQIHEPIHLKALCMPLCMSEDEDVLLLKNCEFFFFIIYNKRDNRVNHLDEDHLSSFHQYVPSLFLPYWN